MQTLTRKHLSLILAEELGLTKTQASQLVDAFFQAMTEAIIQGERIEARGFGVWTVKETEPARRRNPKTDERVLVPARRKVLFKAGKALKQKLPKPTEVGE